MLNRIAMRSDNGLSLIEVIFAIAILGGALVTLAQLATAAVTSNIAARNATAAIVLASRKVDELRAAAILPLAGVDYVDQWGQVLGGGAGNPPRGALFERRWSVTVLPATTIGTRIIDVRVAPLGGSTSAARVLAATR